MYGYEQEKLQLGVAYDDTLKTKCFLPTMTGECKTDW
jgi:hypothetical protein